MLQNIWNVVNVILIVFVVCGIAAYISESWRKKRTDREQLGSHKHWWN